MSERVIELEQRLTFQDQALEEFNRVLLQQQQQIDGLRSEIELLKTRLSAQAELPVAGRHDEKPPHY